MEDLSSSSSSPSFFHTTAPLPSVVEAMAVDTLLAASKSLLCLLILTGSLLTDINHSALPKSTTMDGRFPFEELSKGKQTHLTNKDASDSDADEDDEDDDDDANDQDDEGDEEFSGEGEEEADPEDDPEANGGAGGSDGDENEDDGDEDGDDDEDDDDDGEGEEEDEEDEDDEDEVPQPPLKKRK